MRLGPGTGLVASPGILGNQAPEESILGRGDGDMLVKVGIGMGRLRLQQRRE